MSRPLPTPSQRSVLTLGLVAASLAATAMAAPRPLMDVPSTHWARAAVDATVARGILQGYDGRFSGEKLVNRYQMAVVVDRLLDESRKVAEQVARTTGGVTVLGETQATLLEMAEELGALSARCESLARSGESLQRDVAALRADRGQLAGTATPARSSWRFRRWAGQTL